MGNVFLCSYELLAVEQPEGTVDGCCGVLMTKEKDHEETVRKKNQDHPGTQKSLCQFLKPCFLILHRIKLNGHEQFMSTTKITDSMSHVKELENKGSFLSMEATHAYKI